MLPEEEVQKHVKAGRIAQTCLLEGARLIRPGASIREVLDTIEERIRKAGGGIAFPAQVSRNTIAAHFCPSLSDDAVFEEGDMAKLDIGVHIGGRIADNAITVDLGDHDELLRASREALDAALKLATPGRPLREIGKAIEETITSYGLRPVRNLSGHGLGSYEVHVPPSIPNFDSGDATELQEGQVIAIEPFATDGKGLIFESSNPTIFSFVHARPTRSPFAREALRLIRSYEGLPFASRWLERSMGQGKARLALQELQRNGSLHAHPPLPEQSQGLVSQHEHSVIVGDKPLVFTRLDD